MFALDDVDPQILDVAQCLKDILALTMLKTGAAAVFLELRQDPSQFEQPIDRRPGAILYAGRLMNPDGAQRV